MKENMPDVFDVIIIGAGPAGMMAGISAAKANAKVCLIERNPVLGKKLLLTGKGRCNLTTDKSVAEIVEAFDRKGRFLYGALARFSNEDLIKFLNNRGVVTKVERGGRIFPASNTALTILNCLKNELIKKKVTVVYHCRIAKIAKTGNLFHLTSLDKKSFSAKKIIIATGGKSYPQTGSTGDGYRLAKELGHTITPLRPALVPLLTNDAGIRSLAGLTLKNITLLLKADGEKIVSLFGEMLFTHEGISGPVVLKASQKVGEELAAGHKVFAHIDLKPALDQKTLKNRIQRERQLLGKKEYQSLLKELLPRLLIPLAIKKTHIDKHRKVAELTREEIRVLIAFLKDFSFEVNDIAPIEEGIITGGGVDLSELDSRTMESKIIPGLYFCGEIIDLAGPTGGFNLQKAFSTGWLSGRSAVL